MLFVVWSLESAVTVVMAIKHGSNRKSVNWAIEQRYKR